MSKDSAFQMVAPYWQYNDAVLLNHLVAAAKKLPLRQKSLEGLTGMATRVQLVNTEEMRAEHWGLACTAPRH